MKMLWIVFLVITPIFGFAEIAVFETGVVGFYKSKIASVLELEKIGPPIQIVIGSIGITPRTKADILDAVSSTMPHIDDSREGNLFEISYEGRDYLRERFRGSCYGEIFVLRKSDGYPGIDIFSCSELQWGDGFDGFRPTEFQMKRALNSAAAGLVYFVEEEGIWK